MKPLLTALCLLGFAVAAAAAGASDEPLARPLTSQQQRMKDCNAKASEQALKAQPRRDFMKHCLSGGKVVVEIGETATGPDTGVKPAATTQAVVPDSKAATVDAATDEQRLAWRRKLGSCIGAAKAKALQGQERRSFMSACLKAVPQGVEQ